MSKSTHKKYKKKWYQKYQWREYVAPQAREKADHQCELCGMSNDDHQYKNGCSLHVHHIIDRCKFVPAMEDGRTDEDRIRKIANDQTNLVALCASCHKQKIEQLSIEEQCRLLQRQDPRSLLDLPKLVLNQLN